MVNSEDPAAVFSCSACDLKFTEVIKLIRHLKKTHDITVHMCEFCGGDYENAEALKEHVQDAHPPEEGADSDEGVSFLLKN